MKSLNYTLLLLLLPLWIYGQPKPKWEMGLFVGGANYLGDLVETQYPFPEETNPAVGLFWGINIGYQWTIKNNLLYGRMSGDDRNFDNEIFEQTRNFRFKSDVLEVSLTGQWEPFGKHRYNKGPGFNKIISPYLFAGVGLTLVNAEADFSESPRDGLIERIQADKESNEEIHRALSFPFGGGLELDLSKRSSLGVEMGLRAPLTDYIDGISEAGNAAARDWYLFGGVNFTLRMGPRDKDDDGIVDKEDSCPTVPGLPTANGCPDSDLDGVEDLEDVCPNEPGLAELNGCPDRDGDRVIDIWDECPDIVGTEKTQGCPDTDRDWIADQKDPCPDRGGPKILNGCPDLDEDTIADVEDECPLVPGIPEFNGCPFADKDRDGIPDEEDQCPELPGEKDMNGCPDSDKDGIADGEDKCPTTVGLAINSGCPEISKETRDILDLAMRAVKFETASAVLKKESLKILDQIVDVMSEYPDYSLGIYGHTDSRGNDNNNQVLSEKRAKSCYDYLVSKGINEKRLDYEGFGESKPIGDNGTAKGRSRNRRVEFELFLR